MTETARDNLDVDEAGGPGDPPKMPYQARLGSRWAQAAAIELASAAINSFEIRSPARRRRFLVKGRSPACDRCGRFAMNAPGAGCAGVRPANLWLLADGRPDSPICFESTNDIKKHSPPAAADPCRYDDLFSAETAPVLVPSTGRPVGLAPTARSGRGPSAAAAGLFDEGGRP